MSRKIPQIFLFLSILVLILTAGHWLWRKGEQNILAQQSFRAVALMHALQNTDGRQGAGDTQEVLERSFLDDPDLALVLVHGKGHEPLLLKTRLGEEETKRVQANLLSPAAASLLAKNRLVLHTHEFFLGKRTKAWLHAVYDDTLFRQDRERVIIIAALSVGIVILVWIAIILLYPCAAPESQEEAGETRRIREERSATPQGETRRDSSEGGARSAESPDETRRDSSEGDAGGTPRVGERTSLFSRDSFIDLVGEKCSDKQNLPLALILADIDHFKEVNQSFGREAGDGVLKKIASICTANIPERAIPCGAGGEEFAVIIPECALAEAAAIADTIRVRLATASLLRHRTLTSSFGVSVAMPGSAAQAKSLVKRAESALYFSKDHGRNMVSSNTA